jgi:hypothetical protein
LNRVGVRGVFSAKNKKNRTGSEGGEKARYPSPVVGKKIKKTAHTAYGCGNFSANSRPNNITKLSYHNQPGSTRKIFGKNTYFSLSWRKIPPKSAISRYPCICVKPMGYAYNRGICGEKDWAAVRREERRELPQPVVIVRNLYAGLFE